MKNDKILIDTQLLQDIEGSLEFFIGSSYCETTKEDEKLLEEVQNVSQKSLSIQIKIIKRLNAKLVIPTEELLMVCHMIGISYDSFNGGWVRLGQT